MLQIFTQVFFGANNDLRIDGAVLGASPEFDSQTWRHMWVEFVGSLLYSREVFLLLFQFSPFLKNQPTI